MTTVKVKFRPSTVEGRPGTIVYFVTHRRVVRQITTGYKVFSHEWDDKQSRPVSAPAGERITVIQTIIRKLEENLEKLNRIVGFSNFSSKAIVPRWSIVVNPVILTIILSIVTWIIPKTECLLPGIFSLGITLYYIICWISLKKDRNLCLKRKF